MSIICINNKQKSPWSSCLQTMASCKSVLVLYRFTVMEQMGQKRWDRLSKQKSSTGRMEGHSACRHAGVLWYCTLRNAGPVWGSEGRNSEGSSVLEIQGSPPSCFLKWETNFSLAVHVHIHKFTPVIFLNRVTAGKTAQNANSLRSVSQWLILFIFTLVAIIKSH